MDFLFITVANFGLKFMFFLSSTENGLFLDTKNITILRVQSSKDDP